MRQVNRILAFVLVVVMLATMAPVSAKQTKEVLPCGYEIDMDNLPKVHFSRHPEWETIYDATWQIHKNNIAKIPSATNPESPYYVDEAFSGNIFVWDTMLMMMFDKYGLNEFPTLASIDNFYYNQVDSDDERDGYICREIVEATGKDYWDYNTRKNTGTNPPLFAMAEWEQYQIHGDVSRFSKLINGKTIFERLVAQYNYIERNKKMPNGLYGKTNGFGNGLDNTPNQDGNVLILDDSAGQQTYNDLSIQQAQAAHYISLIAGAMGKTEEAAFFQAEHARISALINEKLWSEEAQMYSNLDADGVTKTNVSTPTNLWALAGLVATEERAKAIIDNHGLNSQKLYRPQGLATTAYDWQNEVSRFHAEGAYWLGSVWAPTSYQYVYGLREYGYDQLAFEEAVRHVNMASDVYQAGLEGNHVSQATVWENYSSEYTKNGSSSRANFAGWTGSFGVGMVLEDLIGVDINAPDNVVTWNVHLTEDFGVDNLYMKHNGVENRVSLHALERASDLSDLHFTATATQPVTLVVNAGGNQKTFQLEAGTHSYVVEGTAGDDAESGYIGAVGVSLAQAGETATQAYYETAAKDYVYFGTEENTNIHDGLLYQTGKNNGTLYNINTVGIPANQGAIRLESSASVEALGFAGAQSVSKGMSGFGNEGFMFMAPASNQMQTMRLVVGVQNGMAILKAGLADASDDRVEMSFAGGVEETEYVVDIPYRAACDDSRVMVQWLLDNDRSRGDARVSVKSIALLDGGEQVPSVPAVVTATANGTAIQVHMEAPVDETYDSFHVALYNAVTGELVSSYETTNSDFTIEDVAPFEKYYVTVSGVKDDVIGGGKLSATVLLEPAGTTDDDRAAQDLARMLDTIYNGNTNGNVQYPFVLNQTGPLYGATFTLSSSADGAPFGVMNNGKVLRPTQEQGDVAVRLTITAHYGSGTATYTRTVLVSAYGEGDGYVQSSQSGFNGGTVNLSEEGTSDWYQFRENVSPTDSGAQAHKKDGSGISNIFRNVDAVPTGEQGLCTDAPIYYKYDANDLTGSAPRNQYGTHMRGTGNYLKFNVGYSEKNQRLNVYVGTWNGVGTVQFLVNGKVMASESFGNQNMGTYRMSFDYLLENPTDVAEVRLYLDKMDAYSVTNGSVILFATTLGEKELGSDTPVANYNSEQISGQTIDLTKEGTNDWFQLPQDSETNYARKANGVGFSGFKRNHDAVPNGEKGCVKDAPIYYTASDADSNYPGTRDRYGMQCRGVGNGLEIRLGYQSFQQEAKIYTGVWNAESTLQFIVNNEVLYEKILGNASGGMQVFCTTIPYQLKSAGDVAIVRLTLTNANRNNNGSTFMFAGTLSGSNALAVDTLNATAYNAAGEQVKEALPGEQITVQANSLEGATFLGWKASGLTLTPEQAGAQSVSFTMPEHKVSLYAQYKLNGVAAEGVTISCHEATLEAGETMILTAQVLPQDAADPSVIWSSDNEAVATVDETGTVTAVSAGQVVITATTTDGGFTDTCLLTVEQPSELTIVTQPQAFVGQIGADAVFHVDVNRTDVTYQWMYSNNGGKSFSRSTLAGANTDTLAVELKAFRVGQMYKCVVTDSRGVVVETNVVTMTTATTAAIVEQPVDYTGVVGSTAEFTVKASGEGLTYQWMYSNNGGRSWVKSSQPGYDTDTLHVEVKAFRAGQMYKCVVTDASGNVVESTAAAIVIGS